MSFAAAAKNELKPIHDRLVISDEAVCEHKVLEWLNEQFGPPSSGVWGHTTLSCYQSETDKVVDYFEFFIRDKALAVMFKLTFHEYIIDNFGNPA